MAARETHLKATAEATAQAAAAADAQNTVDFDEKVLAEASVLGDSQAFEELYTHYFPRVRAFCLRKTSDPALAEDIAQEAFARAFERIGDFGGPKHFGGWVGTIAANLITDHYRRKRNTEVSLDTDDSDRGPAYEVDPIRNLQRQDTSRLVRLALERLDPRQREALLMHEVKGMTCAAVGDQLGISEVAAESLLARARRRLRKEITAKAAPADLFGFGGLGLLPALLRAWRRAKDSVSRRTASLQVAASRGWESVGSGLVPSVDGAKALVVVLGAALAVEAASAASPPVHRAVPAETQTAAATAPAEPVLIAVDGDPTEGLPSAGLPVTGYVDPATGNAGAAANPDVKIPDPGGSEGYTGLNADLGFDVKPKDGLASVRARVFVADESGEMLLDTGPVEASS